MRFSCCMSGIIVLFGRYVVSAGLGSNAHGGQFCLGIVLDQLSHDSPLEPSDQT